MRQRPWVFAAALAGLAACGANGAQAPGGSPKDTPEAAALLFLQAAADSNMARMADLWGTPAGPAGRVNQPLDYQRRLVIMQAYLKHGRGRVLTVGPGATPDYKVVQVEFSRPPCTKVMPITVVRTGGFGWIVNQLDVSAVGVPGQQCDVRAPADSAPAR